MACLLARRRHIIIRRSPSDRENEAKKQKQGAAAKTAEPYETPTAFRKPTRLDHRKATHLTLPLEPDPLCHNSSNPPPIIPYPLFAQTLRTRKRKALRTGLKTLTCDLFRLRIFPRCSRVPSLSHLLPRHGIGDQGESSLSSSSGSLLFLTRAGVRCSILLLFYLLAFSCFGLLGFA